MTRNAVHPNEMRRMTRLSSEGRTKPLSKATEERMTSGLCVHASRNPRDSRRHWGHERTPHRQRL